MAGYNLTRIVDDVLEHFESDNNNAPSFTVHLHPEYWTLNNGSKFLYNNPVAVGSPFSVYSCSDHRSIVSLG